MGELVCCVDFGSTFTKAALVDVDAGELIATADTVTTQDSDVLDGLRACTEQLSRYAPQAEDAKVLACSSAGGGLRIGVVGNEELVTAEAARRVALSSGGRVVQLVSGGLTDDSLVALAGQPPDVVLLVGGTDGGNIEVLLASAAALARARWEKPVVVAGNVDAQAQVASMLTSAGTPHVMTDNVVPQIGVLRPEPARAAIREMFVRHVIGGKHLSQRAEFPEMVQGATPDVVLSAVELLARGLDEERPGAGDVVVVDVGGATTDVHSAVSVDAEDAGLAREVVPSVPVSRTVEADLGMRWSATGTVQAGRSGGLLGAGAYLRVMQAAERMHREPAYVPSTPSARRTEALLASIAVRVAMRRHAGREQLSFAGDGRLVERSGKDLRKVDLLVGSGGVLRHNSADFGRQVLSSACADADSEGWLSPLMPRLVVDRDYVLAPAGLLASEHPEAAWALLRRLYAEETAA